MIMFQMKEAWSSAPGLHYPPKGAHTAGCNQQGAREYSQGGCMMGKLKHEDIERGLNLRLPFGRWLARIIRRSCSNGMWTISRDGKLGCEPLSTELGQPD